MSRLAAYSALERIGPLVTTGEAAVALGTSVSSASRSLAGLEREGWALRLRPGVWHVGHGLPDPFSITAGLTRPDPAYVSFASALEHHGIIDQLPREISVASLGRARRIVTSLGTYAVHRLAPELFGGWQETARGPVATPEKAVFDICYVGAVSAGRPPRIPELELPDSFDAEQVEGWVLRIRSRRLRTLTRRGIEYALSRAVR